VLISFEAKESTELADALPDSLGVDSLGGSSPQWQQPRSITDSPTMIRQDNQPRTAAIRRRCVQLFTYVPASIEMLMNRFTIVSIRLDRVRSPLGLRFSTAT
jgi:hypothetical protein